jgi:hypothetical protein
MQQLSFCGSLHCIIVGEVADTLRQREMHWQVALGGSVSTHIVVDPGTPRCLQVSAILCIVFWLYWPRWQGIKREKNKRKERRKKKQWIGQGYLTLLSAILAGEQAGWQQMPDPVPGLLCAFKS